MIHISICHKNTEYNVFVITFISKFFYKALIQQETLYDKSHNCLDFIQYTYIKLWYTNFEKKYGKIYCSRYLPNLWLVGYSLFVSNLHLFLCYFFLKICCLQNGALTLIIAINNFIANGYIYLAHIQDLGFPFCTSIFVLCDNINYHNY